MLLSRLSSTLLFTLLASVWVLATGCQEPLGPGLDAPEPPRQIPREERRVDGAVTDRIGRPLSQVRVEVFATHPRQHPSVAITGPAGRFSLAPLVNANALLVVSHPDFYSEVISVYLQGEQPSVELPPLALVRRKEGRVRLWLAGDTMFGRRFEDRDEDGIRGEEEDLIADGSRAEDTLRLFRYLSPALASADYRVANFESPASTAEESRHPFKRFSFTSHPETLAGLRAVGVDAVSLGNNHSFDYLEAGRIETETELAREGIGFFGSGASESDAREGLLEVQRNGVELSFQGFNGILPHHFYPDPDEPWDPRYMYCASDEPEKGGALLLSRSNVDDFLERSAGRLAVPILHGGAEYGEFPTGPMRDFFQSAHDGGARLVVAHHSHTVYGVALHGDAEEPGLTLLSLGNFIFDQDVFETFHSYMAVVDIDRIGAGEYRFVQVRLIPFHQENYVPRLVSGPQAEWLTRHVGHLSTWLPPRAEDELRPAVVFADAAGIGVMLRDGDYRTETQSRNLRWAGGGAAFELNQGSASASYLEGFDSDRSEARLRLARDRLLFGDFEDYDVDDQIGENDHWWQTSTRYPTTDQARSGNYSLALYRERGSETPVNTQLRNRITFDEGAELTLGCHFKSLDAGSVDVVAQYIERGTRRQIAEEALVSLPPGTRDWYGWSMPLSPPPEAGHLRFVITMQPPEGIDGGVLYVDDCTLLEWGPTLAPGERLPTPHGFDWGRLEGVGESSLEIVERRLEYHREFDSTQGG